MPIGEDVYGRLFNVIGDPIDGLGSLPKSGKNGLPIHMEIIPLAKPIGLWDTR